jgi:hypothetical protein
MSYRRGAIMDGERHNHLHTISALPVCLTHDRLDRVYSMTGKSRQSGHRESAQRKP